MLISISYTELYSRKPIDKRKDCIGDYMKTICGVDCSNCERINMCKGCCNTNGHPFGGDCVMAVCCQNKGYETCSDCTLPECECKAKLMKEFNELGVRTVVTTVDGSYGQKGMVPVTEALNGEEVSE